MKRKQNCVDLRKGNKWVDLWTGIKMSWYKKNLKQNELIQNKWNNMGWHKKKFKKVVNLWKGTTFVDWIKGNKRVDWRKK